MEALARGPGITTREWQILTAAYRTVAQPLVRAGVILEVQSGLDGLAEMNAARGNEGFLPVLPLFRPHLSKQDDPSFWLYGEIDGTKECSIAGVVRNAPFGLEAALDDLTLFYDQPPGDGAAECEITDVSGMDRIAGRMMVMGALWRSPIFSGGNIGLSMFELGLIEGYSRFKPHWFIGVVHLKDTLGLAHQREGFPWKFPCVVYQDRNWELSRPDMPLTVVAMSRAQALARIASMVRNG